MLKEAREIVGSVRNIYRLDQSEWEGRVRELDGQGLLKESIKNRKLLNINHRLQLLEGATEVSVFVASALNHDSGLAFAFLGLMGATTLMHGRPSVVLNNRLSFIDAEANSRREQAVFYQDFDVLERLDPVFVH